MQRAVVDLGDDLDRDESARLRVALTEAAAELARGEGIPAEQVLAELRAQAASDALVIVVAPRARAQLITIGAWWREHRPEAPELIREEFADARARLRVAPGTGVRARDAPVPGLRRLLLVRARYHVDQASDERRAVVEIMSVWQTGTAGVGGCGPPLRSG